MASTKTKKKTDFESTIAAAYAAQGKTLELGKGVLDGKVAPNAIVQVPLRMTNRHGLIAGATGTGIVRGVFGLLKKSLR